MPTKKVKKAPAKKTAKKAVKRVAKKTAKKSTKKATRKVVVKKAVKRSAKKVTRKTTAKKATKKTPKKAVKKAPAKKTTKKTAKKSSNKKKLIYANDETAFWLTNGQTLNSLIALRDALDEMEKDVFLYHAGGAHNDFANWVEVVLADASCAVDLEKAKTPKSAKTTVVKHLKYYSL